MRVLFRQRRPGVAATLALAFMLQSCQVTGPAITIKRDTFGVPHIYADDTRSLFYGFGYAIAQDRLFQLEMAKRTGNGSVAEVLGPDYVETDIATRQAISPESIQAQMEDLSADDRAMFEGYAAGVNARIKEVMARKSQLLPKPFIDADFEPSQWTAADVAMIWTGLILNRFFGNSMEIDNLALLQQLQASKGIETGRRLYEQLRWLEDSDAPTIIPRDETLSVISDAGEPVQYTALSALAPLSPESASRFKLAQAALAGPAAAGNMPTASSAWVIAPEKTRDGHAVLYNGPQQGFMNPSFIHGIGLHGAGYDLTGMTPTGMIPVLFGTNGTIAWGSTVGSLDTNDIYQEQLNPDNVFEYKYNGSFRPMERRTDIVKVRDGEDRKVDIYSTVHGFVTSWDLENHTAYTVKRSWQGHEIETMLGWADAARTLNWEQYMAQASRVSASITWFYADTRGNIGAAGLGRLPVRPANQDPRFPANGDGSMEWQGILPFSHNPKSFNPEQGYLASWNNQIAAGLRADGANFSAVDRVNEIIVQLEATPKLNPDKIWAVSERAALADLNARYFVPHIAAATRDLNSSDPRRELARLLDSWDMQNRDTDRDGKYDSPAVTVLRTWLAAMAQRLLQDDLPARVYQSYLELGYPSDTAVRSPGSVKPAQVSKLLFNALRGTTSGVSQDYDFFNARDPNTVILEALADTASQLSAQYGDDIQQWLTPVANHSFEPNNALGVPSAGANEHLAVSPYMNRGTTNYRVVLQPGAVSMCSVTAPGQSGFVSSDGTQHRHYSDQLDIFMTFECKSDAVSPAQIEQSTQSVQQLSY